ncbi:MAG TPA: DUF2252 family protein [Candidatus Acidoferrales bacterium]|nr:DUF2252 family protein [Candidatus Acidoferrales bacterium]
MKALDVWYDRIDLESAMKHLAADSMKVSAMIEDWDGGILRAYSKLCGVALARSHARSGDAAMISGYIGSSETFDDAICEFAVEYADQNQRDYRAMVKAVRDGRVKAVVES